MKKMTLCLSVFSLLLCGTLQAQSQANKTNRIKLPNLPANVTPKQYAEILQYMQQMNDYNEPKQIIRRKAMLKADQRRGRMAARKWYGYSNTRPQASHTPNMGTYSPIWSGNSWDPFQWTRSGHHSTATIVIAPDVIRR